MTDTIFDKVKIQFEQFLTSVNRVLANDKDIHILENKLRRHFNSAFSSYLCSPDFQSQLDSLQDVFNQNDKSAKYFKLLNSFDQQLKKHSIKPTESVQTSAAPSSSIETRISTSTKTMIISSTSSTDSAVHLSSLTSEEQTVEQLLRSCNDVFTILDESRQVSKSVERRTTTEQLITNEMVLQRKKKINKLERRLSRLSRVIRRLEKTDMSLDEMENCDLYEVESKLKKQAYEIYIKISHLKNEVSSTKRVLEQSITLTVTDFEYPIIQKAVEEMVNQTKYLPAFHDVLEIVDKTNDGCKLNLSMEKRKSLAEQLFKLIGAKVKNRRMADFNDIMNSRLPEDFDIEQNDPALNSSELENTLIENEREAETKTQRIFEEFSQIDTQLEPEESIESDADENDEIELTVEPVNDQFDDYHYDYTDILPPFSPQSISPVQQQSCIDEDSTKVTDNNLFDALPTSTTESNTYITLDSRNTQESQSVTTTEEHKVQIVIPRRQVQRTLYDYYQQDTVNNNSSSVPKRSTSNDTQSSNSKKIKDSDEIILLD
ncbi:unnamed protein product [Adineta ricciae]|uniref:Daxx histone-binding domain-containing protein n=1 Tax=Adineta ricciae TaxID=249248 RepID=A0A815U1K6_ADIRI|nr:unnamed protein product [Adineta ricciae]